MRLFLVIRRPHGLHSVRVFPETAGAAANHEAETFRWVGWQAKVFLAADLLEVVRIAPRWFAESALPSPREARA